MRKEPETDRGQSEVYRCGNVTNATIYSSRTRIMGNNRETKCQLGIGVGPAPVAGGEG